jgi:MFS family permease
MGISEACYLPAALALIADYHRGTTRSLATGLHMTGVFVGQGLGGLGGLLVLLR